MSAAPLVHLENVTATRGRRRVLLDVSLRVDAGDLIAVHGANGAGKTTLLRLLAGLSRPAAGTRHGPPRAAFVPATPAAPPMRADAWLRGIPRPSRTDPAPLLVQLGYDAPRDAPCRVLSFGNMRKLLLAEAFSSGEALVVVDEATVGLDETGIAGLRSTIADHRARGGAVVVAEQDGRSVPDASRACRVARGRLTDAAPGDSTSVTLWGPLHRVHALLEAGAALGFVPPPDAP